MGIIKRESIEHGELVWLSNGVRGFGWGIVEIDQQTEMEFKKEADRVAREANCEKLEKLKSEGQEGES